MIGAIGSAIGVPKLIAAGLAAAAFAGVAGWGYVQHLKVAARDATIAGERVVRDQLTEANVGLAASLERVQAFHAIEMAAVSADRDRNAATAARAAAATRRILNAPKEDDGPVARVLLDAVGCLRGARASGDLPGPSGAAAAAGCLDGMPRQSGAAGRNP